MEIILSQFGKLLLSPSLGNDLRQDLDESLAAGDDVLIDFEGATVTTAFVDAFLSGLLQLLEEKRRVHPDVTVYFRNASKGALEIIREAISDAGARSPGNVITTH